MRLGSVAAISLLGGGIGAGIRHEYGVQAAHLDPVMVLASE
ncbi:hypothetical protein [Noviherbaspirillum aerium]|nr:hypothetical protein [Noviherbaspirillum aerium]